MMKRKSLRLMATMVLVAASFVANANPVDMHTIREVATKFVNANTRVPLRGAEDLQLVSTYNISRGDAAFHIFNTPNGFVIVAADDCATPILGYSDEGRPFDLDNVPIQLQEYLQGFVEQIEYGIVNNLQPDEATAQQWDLVRSIGRLNNNRDGEAVEPLITTQWDQWWPYNSLCPEGTPTGCVATATAQIMNYWQYPVKGIGYKEYYTPGYGVGYHQVAYNETYYQWGSMDEQHPDAIGTLMYHVGTSCGTHYNNGESGSSIESALFGLRTYFDYSDNMVYYAKIGETVVDLEGIIVPNVDWTTLIKSNLNSSMPILYAGGGHAWVVDGYDVNEMFHMNFGWSGSADGYYTLDMIYASSYNLSDNHRMVMNIIPAYSQLEADYQYATDEYDEMTYSFHDFTKGSYDALFWEFGDGETDTVNNPTHTYIEDSLYTITLMARSGSLTDTIAKNIEIKHNRFFRKVPPYTGDLESNPVGLIIPMDYDMDGRQDIVVHGLEGITIYHNADTGFVRNENPLTSLNTYDLVAIDLYNTNKPSLFSAKCQSYWNNENDQFVLDSAFFLPIAADWIGFEIMDNWKGFDIVDYDNDGLVDIIMAQNDYSGKIFKNIGKGKFLPLDTIWPAYGTWLDIDNDGDMDCISDWQGYINNIIFHNCINDGHGVFHDETYPSGSWGDFSGDGLPDVIIENDLLVNLGNHSFETINEVFASGYTDYSDIDNDGYIEIIDGDSIVRIMDNSIVRMKHDYHIPVFSWADPNGNNTIDIFSSVAWPWSDNHMGTYMNISTTVNTPPTAPDGLSVEILGNDVILHWDAPTDDHTPSAALTYNITVGTTPETCDIYSPLSDLSTGKRYAMNRGNAGLATLWRVNDLPNGTYYWRVQAIDQALAASPFSAVGTFTIEGSNIPPAMAAMESGFAFGRANYFGKSLFLDAYVDRDNDDLAGVMICSLPVFGMLSLYGEAVQAGQLVAYDDLDSLCYHNQNYLNAQDTLFVKPFDGFGYGNYQSPVYLTGKLFELVEVSLLAGKCVWGDFDNDGDLDLAAQDGIYQNTQGSFTKIHTLSEDKMPVVWVDYNHDNYLDCLYADLLWVNDGNGGFTSHEISIGEYWYDKTDFSDINNNNNIDFVYAQNDSLFVRYDWEEDAYLNIQAMRDGGLALGDWNNNGRLDLANTGFDWGNHRAMSVYRDSTDGFVPAMSLEGLGVGNLQWGDYDRDGDLDLLAAGSDNSSSPRSVLYNNNHGVFIQQESSMAGVFGNAYWFDFDNDGWLDVILSGYYVGTLLYRNNQDGTYTEIPPEVSRIPTEIHSITIGDYDNDGFMDVLLSGTCLMRNLLGTADYHPFSVPLPPTQLQSDVQGSHVTLSWEAEDPSKSYSYNVYVRKDGSDDFVVSPLADLASGFRKTVRLGNAEYNNFFNLNSLEEGTYWWSVQAVDNAYNGGAFAQEQSFTVNCQLSDPIHVYDTVCHGYSYEDDLLTEDGIYTINYPSYEGCDSTVYLHLTVLNNCSSIVYVKSDGSDDNNGYSWQTAKASISGAIELAQQNGDTVIWVEAGTYFGNTLTDHAFEIPDGIKVYGSFCGVEPSDFDLTQRDLNGNASILDGQGINNVVKLNDNTLIDGFIIQHSGRNGYGGGVQANSTSIIQNSIIKNNISIWSAGIWGGTVINCLIVENTSMYSGTIESCNVINSTIANNYGAQQYPEHIPVSGAANSQLTNCILWNNQFTTIENCTLSYCAIDADFTEGTGNILLAHNNNGNSPDSLYVRFADPENGDFRLLYGSACINAGTPDISELGLPQTDLLGNFRVMDGRIDKGAFEYNPSSPLIGLSQGWTWYAPTIQTSIESIESSLGNNLELIQSKDGTASGDIVTGEMYKIQTTAPCTLAVTGVPITSATITINPGKNWFGFVGTTKTVAAAFTGFTPAAGDKVISQDEGFAVYENGTWSGTLVNLQPGKGYVYISNATAPKTLVIGE